MLTRYSNWQERLSRFLFANERRKFRYGDFDCALFVADAIREMTGADLAERFRGAYDSRASAAAAMQRYCGVRQVSAVASAIAEEHGLVRISPREAGRGDMVLIARRRDSSLGLMNLNGQDVVIPFVDGLRRIGLGHAVTAWRI